MEICSRPDCPMAKERQKLKTSDDQVFRHCMSCDKDVFITKHTVYIQDIQSDFYNPKRNENEEK